MNTRRDSSWSWRRIAAGFLVLAAFSSATQAQPIILGNLQVEVTSASLNLFGNGGIPLGNDWTVVASDITLRESDTQFSSIDITLKSEEFNPTLPRPDQITVRTEILVSLFPVIELRPSSGSYGGTLGSEVLLETDTPLTASSIDQIVFDFTAVNANATLIELFFGGFDFTTIPSTITNLGMTSDPLVLKKNLVQSIGGDPLENDFIEVELFELSLAGGAFDAGDLLNIDLFSTLPVIPKMTVQGRVNDASEDPEFGPFTLTAESPVAMPEPGTALLLATGGLLVLVRRARNG